MTSSANLSSWENLLFLKTFTKQFIKSNLPPVFQSFEDPLYIIFENETHTSLQSIDITPQALSSYGYSLSLAFDDIQRAHSSILKVIAYHMHLESRKNILKDACVKEGNFLFVPNEKTNVDKSLNHSSFKLVEASESILRILVGLCLYEKINYVQGFLHILLNLCYLNPCPLYNVDSAFHLFHQFLLLACPHLLQSESNRGTSCKSQQTLCLLFHQLLQYHFPSVAYHIDRFHDTVFWNLHWFDCLGTTCFSNPLVWLDVWYHLTYVFFNRLKEATLLEFHNSRVKLWNDNFCHVAMYCEWIFFTLSVIRYCYQNEDQRKSNYFQIGEHVAQKLCAFNESENVEAWDDLWLGSRKKSMTLYHPESKEFLDKGSTLSTHVDSNRDILIPSHLESMFTLRAKTPPFWLCRLTGHVPKNYSTLCQSSFISLFDYSSFYCLPVFWKELILWNKVFGDEETSSGTELCGHRLTTSDSKSTECSSFSSESLSRSQRATNLISLLAHSHENAVNFTNEHIIGHERTFKKDINEKIQAENPVSPEYWSSALKMGSFQRSEKLLFLKVILIPFDACFSSCYPINTPIGRGEDVIHSSFNASYITILTPSRPESKGFRGFQRLCTSVNKDSSTNSNSPPCWLSYSLDTTIALLRQWIEFGVFSTPVFVIGNPISSTNLNQYIPSSIIQDGVIQVVKKKNPNSPDTGWLSYNIEPHPCQIGFFLRCMEAGIKYITLCPDFSSNSNHMMFVIRRILNHFSTYKCVQTSSSMFRRRIVKKPLTAPKNSNRSKNGSSVKTWFPNKASGNLFDSQFTKQANNVALDEATSIKASPPFQQLTFVRRVKINKEKISKPMKHDPLIHGSSSIRKTSIFSWFQSFFQKKQDMSQGNIILSPPKENQKIRKNCTLFYQYHDLPASVGNYRKMIKTPLKKKTFFTTRFNNKKKYLKKKKYCASWWKMRRNYVFDHKNLHLLLPYSKYREILFHETLKWKTRYTFNQNNLNNLDHMSGTKTLIEKPIKSLPYTDSYPAPSKIVLLEKNCVTDNNANLHTVQKCIQKTVDLSFLETPAQTFSALLAFFREYFLTGNDTLLCTSHSKASSNGSQLKKKPHALEYAKNFFFYHNESSVLIMNATCHFIYETRLFCQILYFLFQMVSHARQKPKKIVLYVTKTRSSQIFTSFAFSYGKKLSLCVKKPLFISNS